MIHTSLYRGDSASVLARIASESVDLILTSPPYDNLRTYNGTAVGWGFDKFKGIANESVRLLKPNGVLVWNVSDQCANGSYSCNSMRQVLYFTEELGLRLHQTIAWVKKNPMPQVAKKRYQTAFELLYVFSKGEPKTFNPIMRECKNYGKEYTQKFRSQRGKCSERVVSRAVSKEVVDNNVWTIATANAKETNYVLKDGRKIHHTAVFPMELAKRVIETWSNEGDVVLDPFMGSGTSGIAAVELGRSFIGCELNEDYFTMASERIEEKMKECGYKKDIEPLCASDLLSEKRMMKVRNRKGKKFNLFIQRVECSVYEKCGFSRYHYIDKPINKAAASYLITGAKGNPIAFIAFLNHTFKGCPNGLMVSRFVILPKYRGKGLSMPILSKVCGMLKANKKRVFINTENPLLGKALDRSKCFIGTTFDHKKRKIEYDAKYVHRRGGYAWRKEYCGCAVYGYGSMLKKLSVIREKQKNINLEKCVEKAIPICAIYHIGSRVRERSSYSKGKAVVGGDCAVGGDCRTLGIGGENGLGRAISAIGFADTS